MCLLTLGRFSAKVEGMKREILPQHYKTIAQWLERIALATAVSLVIQKFLRGGSVQDPVVIIGAAGALLIYALAFNILLKS